MKMLLEALSAINEAHVSVIHCLASASRSWVPTRNESYEPRCREELLKIQGSNSLRISQVYDKGCSDLLTGQTIYVIWQFKFYFQVQIQRLFSNPCFRHNVSATFVYCCLLCVNADVPHIPGLESTPRQNKYEAGDEAGDDAKCRRRSGDEADTTLQCHEEWTRVNCNDVETSNFDCLTSRRIYWNIDVLDRDPWATEPNHID